MMGKGKRNKAKHAQRDIDFCARFSELFARNFQKEIRNSEFWPMMVAEFGEEEAERLLGECKGELRLGVSSDEAGDCPTNL